MTTQNISKYISDTKRNILTADVSDNTFAHAIDTNELLLKRDGSWIEWRFDHNTGFYQLPGTSIVLNHTPLTHLDISNTNTKIHNSDGVDARNISSSIDRVYAQAGSWSMSNNNDQAPPSYHDNLINNMPGLRFLSYNSLVTTDHHVRQRVYHGNFTAFIVVELRKYYESLDSNELHDSMDRIIDGMFWGSHAVHIGIDGIGGNNIGLWYDRTYSGTTGYLYIRPMGLGMHNSHHVQIRSDNEPFVSGTDLSTSPMVICSQYHSAYNGVGYSNESSEVDFDPTSSIASVNVCNYQTYTAQSVTFTHTLNGLRFGGKGGFNLGEYMLFNSALSTDEINSVGSHLATKWGSVWQS
jgi:hypothetical protein